jgi:hypothetical protein
MKATRVSGTDWCKYLGGKKYPQGSLVMERFGPIVQDRGERRLNVLFTRAKERVELFTSLTPNRIKDGGAKGKEIFKR